MDCTFGVTTSYFNNCFLESCKRDKNRRSRSGKEVQHISNGEKIN